MTTMVIAGTVLEPMGAGEWVGDDGACSIVATYHPDAGARTWHVTMYVHVARVTLGGRGVRKVAEGWGATRDAAERAMTSNLATLLCEAQGIRVAS